MVELNGGMVVYNDHVGWNILLLWYRALKYCTINILVFLQHCCHTCGVMIMYFFTMVSCIFILKNFLSVKSLYCLQFLGLILRFEFCWCKCNYWRTFLPCFRVWDNDIDKWKANQLSNSHPTIYMWIEILIMYLIVRSTLASHTNINFPSHAVSI